VSSQIKCHIELLRKIKLPLYTIRIIPKVHIRLQYPQNMRMQDTWSSLAFTYKFYHFLETVVNSQAKGMRSPIDFIELCFLGSAIGKECFICAVIR
jgi:hypothetical protein